MLVARDGAELPAPIAHIAPDPLEPAFDPAALARRLHARHTGVKRALLDQSLVSGIGNIYADEALWRARLHWARPTETLNGPEVSRLLEAVREIFAEALAVGGTSFDSLYVNVNGESGYFDRSLAVYGREGQECRCVRHADQARPVHEPLLLQLPPLPAPPPPRPPLTSGPARRRRAGQNPSAPGQPNPLFWMIRCITGGRCALNLTRKPLRWETEKR